MDLKIEGIVGYRESSHLEMNGILLKIKCNKKRLTKIRLNRHFYIWFAPAWDTDGVEGEGGGAGSSFAKNTGTNV